jgi:hypothetical protein
MKENICAIFLPHDYRRIYNINSVYYQKYATQKIALELEQHLRQNSIHRYILNLNGWLALDTAKILVELRNIYPFITIDFVADTTKIFLHNEEYQKMHNALLQKADNKISSKDISNFPNKIYWTQHACPEFYIYPLVTANHILTVDVSRLLERMIRLAERDNKKISYFRFMPIKKFPLLS